MKKKIDLQLFAEAVAGSKFVYLFRILKDAATADGTTLAFTTENTRTKSKDADSTATKDGSIRTPGAAEVEISATAILAKGDTMISKLEDAMDNDELIEIWEANLEEPAEGGANKFKGMYFQGYVTELEFSSNAEDHVEASLTFAVNGTGKRGDVTVSAEQQEMAAYVFTDTQKTGA
jgi:TP901-1 family phage major tail protein